MVIRGKVYVFGDNVNTDLITSGKYLYSPIEEAAQHAFESIEPDFIRKIDQVNIIVGGKNFGCGSSREVATQVLKFNGIQCVIAESISRIFYRNCIAIGLPALIVSNNISKEAETMDEMEVNLVLGKVVIKNKQLSFYTKPMPEFMIKIIKMGGLIIS